LGPACSEDDRVAARKPVHFVWSVVMATCPECDVELDIDEFEVEKGDVISCPECGSNLEVTGLSPLEIEVISDDDDDDDEDDFEEDEEDAGEDEEETWDE
jgi:alpha-aminoadipate carrier protein LysW